MSGSPLRKRGASNPLPSPPAFVVPARGWVVGAALLLVACREPHPAGFTYDPAVPYPLLSPGDFWPDQFDQRGLQNAVLYRDRLYCNTIDVGGNNNFLYCLSPVNGRVVWRAPVAAFASQPVMFRGDTAVYCSYLGDLYAFDQRGAQLWHARLDRPYAGHVLDSCHARLLVTCVYWPYVYAYDLRSGHLLEKITDRAWHERIEQAALHPAPPPKRRYQFWRRGKRYRIACGPDAWGAQVVSITCAGQATE